MASRKTKRRDRARRRSGVRKGISLGLKPVPAYEEITMKLQCRGPCGLMLEADEHFTIRKDVSRGYQYECKGCRNVMNTERRQRLRDEERQRARQSIADKEVRGRVRGNGNGAPEPKPKPTKKRVSKKGRNKEEHRMFTLQRAGPKIAAGELAGETARSMTYVLSSVLEQQLQLFYGPQVSTMHGKMKVNEIIDTAVFELKEALSRAGGRVRTAVKNDELIGEPTVDNFIDKRTLALGVMDLLPGAAEDEIKTAYRKKAMEYHPDKPGGSKELMQRLNDALGVLMQEVPNG